MKTNVSISNMRIAEEIWQERLIKAMNTLAKDMGVGPFDERIENLIRAAKVLERWQERIRAAS